MGSGVATEQVGPYDHSSNALRARFTPNLRLVVRSFLPAITAAPVLPGDGWVPASADNGVQGATNFHRFKGCGSPPPRNVAVWPDQNRARLFDAVMCHPSFIFPLVCTPACLGAVQKGHLQFIGDLTSGGAPTL